LSKAEDILAQQEILTSLRRRLGQLLKQQAILGAAHAPPAVAAEILEARSEIERVKDILHGWGVPIEPMVNRVDYDLFELCTE